MESNAPRVFRFSTDQFPEHKRVDAYREIYSRTIVKHDIEPIADQPFHFEATLSSFSGLGLASSLFSPCRRWNGPHHLNGDDLVLGVGISGRGIVQQRGREAVVGAGEALLTSCTDPALVTIPERSQLISVRVPASTLAARIAGLGDRVTQTIPHGTPVKLLTGYVGAVWQSGVTTMQPELREVVAAHIEDLVCLVLGAEGEARELAQQRGLRAARLSAILRAIEGRSGDPGLSAATVAAALGITPRYVHLLLEQTGKSFTHHLLQRRLEKAAALLADPRWHERRIADIAAKAGFTDLSYFGRAFRRMYGASPSDLRAASRPDGGLRRGNK